MNIRPASALISISLSVLKLSGAAVATDFPVVSTNYTRVDLTDLCNRFFKFSGVRSVLSKLS